MANFRSSAGCGCERHLRSCWQLPHAIRRLRTGDSEADRCGGRVAVPGAGVEPGRRPAAEPAHAGSRRQRLSERRARSAVRHSCFRGGRRACCCACPGWFLWSRQARASAAPGRSHRPGLARGARHLRCSPCSRHFQWKSRRPVRLRKTVKAKLQIWSDRDNGRFASRFSETGGALRHALWRPSARYRIRVPPRGILRGVSKQAPHREETMALESLADYGLDPAELEAAFLHWLESRSWNPISFASDISSWTAADGSIASAERYARRGRNADDSNYRPAEVAENGRDADGGGGLQQLSAALADHPFRDPGADDRVPADRDRHPADPPDGNGLPASFSPIRAWSENWASPDLPSRNAKRPRHHRRTNYRMTGSK